MTDTRTLSNQEVTVWIGPEGSVANYNAPTLAEVEAMLNVSGAVNWDSFDFNTQASDSQDDRTLTDAAGAKSRSYAQFGGNIEFVWPDPSDTASIYRQAYNMFKTQRQYFVAVIRTVKLNSLGIAVGDRVSTFHVLSDASALVRGAASYAYTVNFLAWNDLGISCIIPAAEPTAVTVTSSGDETALTVGVPNFLQAIYEGNDVTVGATYTSSDQTVVIVTPHGIEIPIAAGTATVTVSYPGSAAGTARPVTVTA